MLMIREKSMEGREEQGVEFNISNCTMIDEERRDLNEENKWEEIAAPREPVEAPQGEIAEVRASVGEGESSSRYSKLTRRGKEPVEEEIEPLAGLEHPFPHRVTDVGEEECEKMRKYLIGLTGVSAQHGQEPDLEYRFEPEHYLDVRETILGSRQIQSKAVEQFWFP
ncbi:uncharacterized protein A4U43_C06F19610 [Asparagus officinalis]|uniref:Uncharacterized protein n=1 Tax=Asparagus officinalis TaxID=4686 RepID=A0A5P1ENK3_ASPOF|nr:uncharacterized protein A4U43_C06F19610 [Asparagus officinalis]